MASNERFEIESLFPNWGEAAVREQTETMRKVLKGAQFLREMRQSDLDGSTTPKELVYTDGHLRLFHYLPVRPAESLLPPILIVYSLVNRYYMIDLQPDRSLVRRLLDKGADLYVIDWGYPTAVDRWTTMEDHIGYLGDCADVVRERHDLARVNLLGICQGGYFTLCYAALNPERVANLITMITPVDFDEDDTLIARVARNTDADRLVDSLGNIPGSLMHQQFLLRSPFAQNVQKYADLVNLFEERESLITFLRMERWVNDSPDHPGETFRQWVKAGYQQNKLVKGTFELDGRRVLLSDVRIPVLNMYAARDDIVEPASSAALEKYIGSADYTAHSFPVGHIGMYVSSKLQSSLPSIITEWLSARS
jgi:polyhydroxyalkanoate synthase